jgi:hypothetical protein
MNLSTSRFPFLTCGSRDGLGAADHDQPFWFGRRPTCDASFPFTTREYARLLLLRSRIRADPRGKERDLYARQDLRQRVHVARVHDKVADAILPT